MRYYLRQRCKGLLPRWCNPFGAHWCRRNPRQLCTDNKRHSAVHSGLRMTQAGRSGRKITTTTTTNTRETKHERADKKKNARRRKDGFSGAISATRAVATSLCRVPATLQRVLSNLMSRALRGHEQPLLANVTKRGEGLRRGRPSINKFSFQLRPFNFAVFVFFSVDDDPFVVALNAD